MKRTVSPFGTHSFILWNARFQCLKLCGCPFPPHHVPVGDKCAAGKSGAGKFSNVYGVSGNNVTAGQIGEYQSEIIKAQKYEQGHSNSDIMKLKQKTAVLNNENKKLKNNLKQLNSLR